MEKKKKVLRESMIGVSCTAEEKRKIEKMAERAGMTISSYVRCVMLGTLPKTDKPEKPAKDAE